MLMRRNLSRCLKIHTDDNVDDSSNQSSVYKKHLDHNDVFQEVTGFRESFGKRLDGAGSIDVANCSFFGWQLLVRQEWLAFHEIIDFLVRSSIHNALTGSLSTNIMAIFDAYTAHGGRCAGAGQGAKVCLTTGKVTPLFASMLVQSTEDEGATSERPSEPQPTPSPPHPSKANIEPQSDPSPRPSPSTYIFDSILESFGGNHRGQSSSDKSLSGNKGDMTLQSVYDLCITLCTQVLDQAKEIKHLKAQIQKLKKKAKPVITHHRAWMKSVSLKQRLAGKRSLKKNWMQKESVSKQGRKSAKAEPSVHKNPLFDELPEDTMDNIETKDAQDVGRTRDVMNEEKETADDEVSAEDVLCTAQQKVSTDKEKVSTDRPNVSTDRTKVSTAKEKDITVRSDEGTIDQTKGRRATPTTPTTTPTIFGDYETIAQVLLNMSQAKAVSRENEKGIELKDVEDAERPRPNSTRSLLTLKPLPKIDPKDKGKKKIEEEDESETESEDILEAEKKKRLAEEEATKTALSDEYGFIQARIEADRLLALRLQAQRRFLAEQRAIAIRNKPPTRTQLRNKMMTYLKHVGNKKHSDLKRKTFEEIQAMYEKVKRFDESFTVVGSTEDERRIKEMNEGVKDTDQKRLKKDDTAAKQDVKKQGTKKRKGGHIKMIARKKKRTLNQYCFNRFSSPDRDYLFYIQEPMGTLEHSYYSWQLEDRIVIHILVERRYPLSKDLLQRILDLGLEVERESTVATDLIRFFKTNIFMEGEAVNGT
ncbi:hypothetical protein Tco_0151679 [Tanacetum coccineum]